MQLLKAITEKNARSKIAGFMAKGLNSLELKLLLLCDFVNHTIVCVTKIRPSAGFIAMEPVNLNLKLGTK